MGIYSSHYCWPEIVGSGWDLGGEYPLWYAHYDGKPNFSDWNVTEKPFGGWTSPTIKQYGGVNPRCGVAGLIDEDWKEEAPRADKFIQAKPGERNAHGQSRPNPPPATRLPSCDGL